LKADRNTASEEVARRKKAKEDASTALAGLKDLSDEIKRIDDEERALQQVLEERLLRVPNTPLPELPDGDATANRVVRTWGEVPKLAFTPKPHWEIGQNLGLFDLPRGAKITGSGFPVFTGLGARLVRALINFMLDLHTREHGYVEIAPPFLVNRETAQGTGQLPDLENNMYVTTDGFYLIPTAEVPVTNLHRDDILAADDLPRGYVAYTPCFRREAGAHGKDTRGLIRIHQFDKVELVRFAPPEKSPAEHEKLTGHAEEVLRRLGIPYRVVMLATGDIGFASAKTYDLEVWAAGVGTWLEASSASTFTDFQARRANIRYRPRADAKPEFLHTLNASGVAFPRTIIAILENNQQPDGSVNIPAALAPYFGRERLSPGGA
jgi:seryl-tRNA synthetase